MTKYVISTKGSAAEVFSSKGVAAAVVLLALSLGVAAPALSQQQGVDCATDRNPDEVAVCSSSLLLQLDRQLNGIYASLREQLDGNQQIILRDSQRYWMRQRAACGSDTNCIYRLYQERIQRLNAVVVRAPPLPTPPPAGRPSPADACDKFPTLCN
jgi:uncharacterized protein